MQVESHYASQTILHAVNNCSAHIVPIQTFFNANAIYLSLRMTRKRELINAFFETLLKQLKKGFFLAIF